MNAQRVLSRVVFSIIALAVAIGGGCGSTPSAADSKAKPTGTYSFWPSAPDEPRIQFVGSFDSSEDVSPTQASGLEKLVFGAEAVKPAEVNKPYGVLMKDGKIYVCDIRAKSVVILDLVKKQTRLMGVSGAHQLERPIAIAIADDGTMYVADGVHQAVLVYDSGERFTMSFKIANLKPGGLAVYGERLYLSDLGRQVVLVLDRKTGKELGTIGAVGDDDGQFRVPIGVATDKEGNIYVADMMRCRVQKFSKDGKFIAGVGEQGDHAGGFARPKHLAVDSEGIVYVVDSAFQNVQMFNDKFQLLMHFGAAGDFPGAMNLPVGIAVTDSSLDVFKDRIHPGFEVKRMIVVANQFGDNKVSVYALGSRRKDYSLADLRASGATVNTGVAEPTAEMLKFQNIGGVEPSADGGNLETPTDGEGAGPAEPKPAQAPKQPAPQPTKEPTKESPKH